MDKPIGFDDILDAVRGARTRANAIEEEERHAFSIPRAIRTAFRPSRFSPVDRDHLASCSICQHRLQVVREQGHPTAADLLMYFAGTLDAVDREQVGQHLAEFCVERTCTRYQLVRRLRGQLNAVGGAAETFLEGLRTFGLDLPEPGYFYASEDRPVRLFSETIEQGQWQVTLEQAAENSFFLGVRSREPMHDVAAVEVAVLRGNTVYEARLRFDPEEHWSAKNYFDGYETLVQEPGQTSILVLPVTGRA
jgi:hypothetical protein